MNSKPSLTSPALDGEVSSASAAKTAAVSCCGALSTPCVGAPPVVVTSANNCPRRTRLGECRGKVRKGGDCVCVCKHSSHQMLVTCEGHSQTCEKRCARPPWPCAAQQQRICRRSRVSWQTCTGSARVRASQSCEFASPTSTRSLHCASLAASVGCRT
eukprot:6463692-Amphidinium_carterae.1